MHRWSSRHELVHCTVQYCHVLFFLLSCMQLWTPTHCPPTCPLPPYWRHCGGGGEVGMNNSVDMCVKHFPFETRWCCHAPDLRSKFFSSFIRNTFQESHLPLDSMTSLIVPTNQITNLCNRDNILPTAQGSLQGSSAQDKIRKVEFPRDPNLHDKHTLWKYTIIHLVSLTQSLGKPWCITQDKQSNRMAHIL